MGHSSGGLPVTEVGDHPTVAHLVYLDGVLVDAVESIAALLAGQIDEKFGVFWRRREGVTWADPDALLAYLAAEGAGLALEQQRARPLRHAFHESVEACDLRLATDHRGPWTRTPSGAPPRARAGGAARRLAFRRESAAPREGAVMVSRQENELITRVESDAPLGRLMREHYWIPFALSENLVPGGAPAPVRLFGENYVAFRAEDGRIGFLDELCPHRRASLLLARVEGNCLRCIYHGWKMDVSGRVVEAPTQLARHDQFVASVPVTHFPVHELGGIAWVWLGGTEAPAFPDLPFSAVHGVDTCLTVSVVPCNWLQGLEGGLDSVHGPILHETWLRDIITQKSGSIDTEGVQATFAAPPVYETEEALFGLRTVSLRPAGEGRTFMRLSHYFFPLVIVVPTGYEDHTQIFAFAPIDDTNHLLFFGNYGTVPQMSQREFGSVRDDVEPDPRNFASVQGDRWNRWGQDRELMDSGHHTGFARSVIDEDAVVQVSMGPILDRTKENLSASDVAVAQARRLILVAITSAEAGRLPPGSARSPEVVRIPHPCEAVLEPDTSWRDVAPVG